MMLTNSILQISNSNSLCQKWTVSEYYNDSIPQNGTGFWSVKLPVGDSLRPGLQKITVWIPYVNLIGEPTVNIFGKSIFVAFVCSDRNVVMHSDFCSH